MNEKDDYHYSKKLIVALQGEIGSFSEMAALRYFGSSVEILSCNSFDQVARMIKEGNADYAILPIENSQTGGINNVHDLLLNEELFAVGEVILKIEHCLISHNNTGKEIIEKIYSHPQALAQCERYLIKNFPHCQIIPVYDTAGSIKKIKESKELAAAGIASQRASSYYKMKIIEKGIEDNPFNYTRFLVLCPKIITNELNDKTSIIFAVVSVPGAIYKCLREFSIRKINLTRLESRPSRMKPWEYIFYLDFENGLQEKVVSEALEALKNCTTFIKIIGTYKSHSSKIGYM